jgi:hypothetical protein
MSIGKKEHPASTTEISQQSLQQGNPEGEFRVSWAILTKELF